MESPVETAHPDAVAEISDETAIDEVLRGNREMFEVLVRRYNQQLFRVGMACFRQREQAEDAMQNAYLKAYVNLGRFRRTAAFSTWLTRIMINECRMLLRRRRSAREDDWRDDLQAVIPDGAEPVGSNLSLNEMKTLLEHALRELPQKYRTVYVLREVQQLTTAETAACLGISRESVKVTLHRAREQLKARLLKSAAASELFTFAAPMCNGFTARVMAAVLAIG
jgi:RNA polymerase sigma-70 factor (ECF subfamily)